MLSSLFCRVGNFWRCYIYQQRWIAQQNANADQLTHFNPKRTRNISEVQRRKIGLAENNSVGPCMIFYAALEFGVAIQEYSLPLSLENFQSQTKLI
jgi:hypothetical protein